MDATPETEERPVRHGVVGRGVDPVAHARTLAAPGPADAAVLDSRIAAPAEVQRRMLAALLRIEAQNEAIIEALFALGGAPKPSRGRG